MTAPTPRCRRCRREIESDRAVFCSRHCLDATDDRALRVAQNLHAIEASLTQQRAEVEAKVAAYAFELHRMLRDTEENAAAQRAELAPLKADLSDAKAARELHWALASDGPLHDSLGVPV